MNLGDTIAKKRKEKNLTQEGLAKKLKVSASTISSWETGKSEPSVEDIEKLGSILGINVDKYIETEEELEENKSIFVKDIIKVLYMMILVITPAIYFYATGTDLMNQLINKTANGTTFTCQNLVAYKSSYIATLLIPYGYYTITMIANYIFYKMKSKISFAVATIIEIAFFFEVVISVYHFTNITADVVLFVVPALTSIIQYVMVHKNKAL